MAAENIRTVLEWRLRTMANERLLPMFTLVSGDMS